MLIEAGDHEGAIRVAQELIAEGRSPRRALQPRLARLPGAGRIQEAYDALREATRLEPKAPENYVDLATICVEHDNFDLGLEIVDIGLRQLPDSWMLHLAARRAPARMKARDGGGGEGLRDRAPPRARRSRALRRAGHGLDAERARRTRRSRSCAASCRGARTTSCRTSSRWRCCARARSPRHPAARRRWKRCGRRSARTRTSRPRGRSSGRLLLKRDELDPRHRGAREGGRARPRRHPALYDLSQAYRKKGDRAGAGAAGAGQQAQRAGARGRSGRRAAARGGPHREGRDGDARRSLRRNEYCSDLAGGRARRFGHARDGPDAARERGIALLREGQRDGGPRGAAGSRGRESRRCARPRLARGSPSGSRAASTRPWRRSARRSARPPPRRSALPARRGAGPARARRRRRWPRTSRRCAWSRDRWRRATGSASWLGKLGDLDGAIRAPPRA